MILGTRFALTLSTVLLLVGCPQGAPVVVDSPCDHLSLTSSPSPKSDSLNIAVYVDGTPSMLGFVKNPTNNPARANTRYNQTIDLLDKTFLLGGTSTPRTKSQIEYYRLGETGQKILRQRDGYLDARLPKFYNGSNQEFPLLKVSKIDTVIPPAGDDKLTVIVTDLYQAREDVNKINALIKANYLDKYQEGYAVGILAIKSEFNGDVYIEDGSNKKFTYNTNDGQGNLIKGKEFRPFYVIFLGHYSDISYYFEKLRNSQDLTKDSNLAIFSPNNLVSSLSSLQDQNLSLPNGIEKVGYLGNIAFNDHKTQSFKIDSTATQEFTLPYSVPFASKPDTLLIDPNSIKTDIKIQAYDTITKQLADNKEPSLQKALELSKWQIDANNLSFITKIQPSAISIPGDYLFTVEALAKGVQPQQWWTEWSSNNNAIEDWRTYNLLTFLEGLKTITDNLIIDNQVVVGRFCYAIQKN